MKIALTGATGFVGSATLNRLIPSGHNVRALTRRPQAERASVEWVAGSLADKGALAALCERCDVVIHVAGVVGARDPDIFEQGNVVGTAAMIDAATRANVRRFIHVSSLAAREPELSLYCNSKARAEALVTASALDWTVVRPPAVYGPGDSEMVDAYRVAERGLMPMPPRGRISLIHVDDLARLLVSLVGDGAQREILEPDDGHAGGWSHADYARMIGAAVGRKPRVIHMPAAVLKLAARADELLRGDDAKLTRDRAAYLVHPNWVADQSRKPDPEIWQPLIESERGIAETVRWYRAEGWLGR